VEAYSGRIRKEKAAKKADILSVARWKYNIKQNGE